MLTFLAGLGLGLIGGFMLKDRIMGIWNAAQDLIDSGREDL